VCLKTSIIAILGTNSNTVITSSSKNQNSKSLQGSVNKNICAGYLKRTSPLIYFLSIPKAVDELRKACFLLNYFQECRIWPTSGYISALYIFEQDTVILIFKSLIGYVKGTFLSKRYLEIYFYVYAGSISHCETVIPTIS